MQGMTHPVRLGRRPRSRARTARVLAAALAALAIAPAACRDPAPTDVSSSPIDPSLVGTWKGNSVSSDDAAVAILTMPLNVDSTMSAQVDALPLCKVTGVWTVLGGQFTATGRDCSGVSVTFVAPALSSRLIGTWTSSTGGRGTFNVGTL
jgi:hypothetical protein